MAKDSDKRGGSFGTENTGGLLSGFLAEEDEFDRRSLWRLGSWAVASVGAVIVAILANQSSTGTRREQIASADLTRQQIQSVAKESQSEARRLASAIETLNGDRDRLYSRVSVLEQGLDSVTGAIARQNSAMTPPQAAAPAASPAAAPVAAAPAAAAPIAAAPADTPAMAQKQPAAPVVSPVAATAAVTAEKPPAVAAAADPGPAPSGAQGAAKVPAETPATSLMAAKSMMAPPDPAAGKLIEPAVPPKAVTAAPMPEVVAATPPGEEAEPDIAPATPKLAVQRTEFGVDVGGANSLPGLRALWRGLLKSRSNAALTTLRPIIVIKEGNNGLGMQLRLVAGPIVDAAAAAKICAAMIENDRACTTTVFEGQRLAMNAEEPAANANASAKPEATEIKPASAAKPAPHKHYTSKRSARDEPAPKEPSTLSRLFGTR